MKWLLMVFKIGNDVQQKGWYTSKTVWFNILSLVAAVAALKGFDVSAEDVITISAAASTFGNIWLRFTTEVPVGSKTVKQSAVPMQPVGKIDDSQRPDDTKLPFDGGTIMG